MDVIGSQGSFLWSFVSQPIKPEDYKDPLRILALRETYEFDTSATHHKYLASVNNKLIDNRNELFGDVLRKEFVSLRKSGEDTMSRDASVIHCKRQDIHLVADCPEFYSFEISGGEEEVIIRREYKRLAEMLGELGGLLKLLTGLMLLYTFYNLKNRAKYFTRSVLDQKSKSSQKSPLRQDLEKNKSVVRDQAPQHHQDLLKDFSSVGSLAVQGDSNNPQITHNSQTGKPRTVVNNLYRSRMSSENVVKGMNLLDVLQDLMTQDSERILIPLALTKIKQNQRKNQSITKIFQQSYQKQSSKDPQRETQSDNNTQKREKLKGGILGELLSDFLSADPGLKNYRFGRKKDSNQQNRQSPPRKGLAMNFQKIAKLVKSNSGHLFKKPKIIMKNPIA